MTNNQSSCAAFFLPSGAPLDEQSLPEDASSVLFVAVPKPFFSVGSFVCAGVRPLAAFCEEDFQPGAQRTISYHVTCAGEKGV